MGTKPLITMRYFSIALVFFATLHYIAWFRHHDWDIETSVLIGLAGAAIIIPMFLCRNPDSKQ